MSPAWQDPRLIAARTGELERPSPEILHAIAQTPKTAGRHAHLLRSLTCLNTIEISQLPQCRKALTFPFTCIAWNVERCLFPQESAQKISAQGADLVLLSEVDNGMARTKQRHTSLEIAQALKMNSAFGVEFLELGLGGASEQRFCTDVHNTKGFHGNAVMAPASLERTVMVRLDESGLWFRKQGDQPRVGGRCAIVAEVASAQGAIAAVSVHLESDADAAYRLEQMRFLFDTIDQTMPDLPVLLGGDLNTGNRNDGDFEAEGLFAEAARRGYERHGNPLDGMTLRSSLISTQPPSPRKLDWFLTRGLLVEASWIVPATKDDGTPLSDHEMIACTIAGCA